MKRTGLGPGRKSLERGSTFSAEPQPLKRQAPLTNGASGSRDQSDRGGARRSRSRPVSPASPAQRAKVKGKACIVCAGGPCHPAHLIDRSLGGNDDPRAVVPLCPSCHRLYDEGGLDLLGSLEPRYREELAYAVELVGLVATLRRVTNDRWAAERTAA